MVPLPRRYAVIRSSAIPVWRSCDFIMSNLERAYLELAGTCDVRLFTLSPELGERDLSNFYRELKRYSPDVLALIHEGPFSPWFLADVWPEVAEHLKDTKIIVHCYGDFTAHASTWLRAADGLLGRRVGVIAASHRAASLVGATLVDPRSVSVCPFPVDPVQFYFDEKAGAKTRESLETEDDELVLIYAGRVSMQKNVTFLCQELSSFAQSTGKKCRLLIAGTVDDLGFRGMQQIHESGLYFQTLAQVLRQSPKSRGFRVDWLGALGSDALREIYSAADAFVSLGAHHNEDFGMAPAEALMSGCPAILSDWGGYASFQQYLGSPAVHLIPVNRDRAGTPCIDSFTFGEVLRKVAMSNWTSAKRKALSRSAASAFSVQAVSRTLAQIGDAAAEFRGFNSTMAEATLISPSEACFIEPRFDDFLYKKLYFGYGTDGAGGSANAGKVSSTALNPA